MPVLARVYHIPPSEQHKLTLEQFHLLQQDHVRVVRAAEEEG